LGIAILHTIFFHRYFIPVTPKTRDLLDTTLPAVDDNDLETDIDQQAYSLTQTLQSSSLNTQPSPYSNNSHNISRPSTHAHTISTSHTQGIPSQNHRASMVVQFLEKKRRKTYFSFGKQDEDVIWEQWTLDVTTATPRTDTGKPLTIASEHDC
jgi:autophagy-related protein 101